MGTESPAGPARSAAIAAAARRLAAAGVPSARHDAQELAALSLGIERGELWRHPTLGAAFASYIERRAAREPLQHITGRAYFRHVALAVGPGVFLPRPETELVAETAIIEARAVAAGTGRAPVVVDLCTGSGAIIASVVDEVPGVLAHAVELDPAAHAWAERNLAGTGVDLRRADMAEAFCDLDGLVDVVVSNPPYIPLGAAIRDPEVAVHDPGLALWSGADGLDALRVVATVAARLLRSGGLVVVEHADVQGHAAPAVLAATPGLSDAADHRDLAGRDRYATARRQ